MRHHCQPAHKRATDRRRAEMGFPESHCEAGVPCAGVNSPDGVRQYRSIRPRSMFCSPIFEIHFDCLRSSGEESGFRHRKRKMFRDLLLAKRVLCIGEAFVAVGSDPLTHSID